MVDRIELSSRHLKPAHCRAPRIAVPVSREFHSVRLYYLQVVPTQLLSYTVSPTSLFETGIRTLHLRIGFFLVSWSFYQTLSFLISVFVCIFNYIVISDFCFCLQLYRITHIPFRNRDPNPAFTHLILLSFVVFLPNIVISDFCFCLHI